MKGQRLSPEVGREPTWEARSHPDPDLGERKGIAEELSLWTQQSHGEKETSLKQASGFFFFTLC
jgi:hypothetical protein